MGASSFQTNGRQPKLNNNKMVDDQNVGWPKKKRRKKNDDNQNRRQKKIKRPK